MCDLGISALVTGIVSSVLGTTMGVVSGIQNSNAQKAQADYQAEVARQNARIANQNASNERQEGIEEARLTRMKNLQKVASQQSSLAANNVDISSGTALDIVEDTATMGELDALNTRYNSETRANAYEQQANNYNNQAQLDAITGQNVYKSNVINALAKGFGGLSSDFSSINDKWYSKNSLGKK